MKRNLLAISLLCLLGCNQEQEPIKEEKHYDYEVTKEDQIKWEDIFSMPEDRYVIYFYSEYCGYCRSVKDEILSYYLLGLEKMYFVNVVDNETVYKTPASDVLGMKRIEDFYISGTPTIIEIMEWTVTNLYVGLDNVRLYISP